MDEKDRDLLNHMKELEKVPIGYKIGSFIIWGLIIYFIIWIFK